MLPAGVAVRPRLSAATGHAMEAKIARLVLAIAALALPLVILPATLGLLVPSVAAAVAKAAPAPEAIVPLTANPNPVMNSVVR